MKKTILRTVKVGVLSFMNINTYSEVIENGTIGFVKLAQFKEFKDTVKNGDPNIIFSQIPTDKLDEVGKYDLTIEGNEKKVKGEEITQGQSKSFSYALDELVINSVGYKITIKLKDSIIAQFFFKYTMLNSHPNIPIVSGSVKSSIDWVNDYLKREKLKPISKNKDYKIGDTVFVFIDSLLNIVEGTKLPNCSAPEYYYKFLYLKPSTSKDKIKYTIENIEENDLNIDVGNNNAISSGSPIEPIPSLVFGPYSGGVDIKIELLDLDGDIGKSKKYSIGSCVSSYQVSIMGGFFASTLNNPENITIGSNKAGDTTLIADNSTSQKALTIMAIFYPNSRNKYYKYKDLEFWEKWSICFGTKLSQNLFDDFLLGVSYEFSKGGNFAFGAHYGQHKVLAGLEKFKYGKDKYPRKTFDNAMIKNQWDFGLFFGVCLDLRIIGELTKRGNDLKKQYGGNSEKSESKKGEEN